MYFRNDKVLIWVFVATAIYLCINGFLASKASSIAEDKGYEKRTWFHMCFWLGVISYVIIAAMPDLRLRELNLKLISIQGGVLETLKQTDLIPKKGSVNTATMGFTDLPTI